MLSKNGNYRKSYASTMNDKNSSICSINLEIKHDINANSVRKPTNTHFRCHHVNGNREEKKNFHYD